MCSKMYFRLSLAISLKFPQGAILATTLAPSKARAPKKFLQVETTLKILPHKETLSPPPPPPPPHEKIDLQKEKQPPPP